MVKILMVSFLLFGCAKRSEYNTITVKGSDTMVILGQRWAEEYMKKNPNTIVQITGGGSGTGIAALIDARTDICQSSRVIKDEEKKLIVEKRHQQVKEIPVAMDGVTVYLHAENPINEMTLQQLKNVYTGKIKSWKEIGWEDARIILYSRENNSGTYIFFKEHVLENEDFAPEVLTLPGTAAVINAVSKDKFSIGYGGIAYAKDVKVIKIKKDDKSPGILPKLENVKKGIYPLSRYLYFYIVGEPNESVKKFIDWVLSDEGQSICEIVGYFPIK